MKWLIDCGATSCKLSMYDGSVWHRKKLVGFNPHNHPWDFIEKHWSDYFTTHKTSAIRFYGAGLNHPDLCNEMRNRLQHWTGLHPSRIEVYGDVLACAHAAYEGKEILVGILGTGSSIGHYDGLVLSSQTKSKAFPIGDEGSGADLGRRLMELYQAGQVVDLQDAIQMWLLNDENTDVDFSNPTAEAKSVYASLAPIIKTHEADLGDLIQDSFHDYIDNRVLTELTAHPKIEQLVLFGSIAFQFQDHLAHCLSKLVPQLVLQFHQSPMPLLEKRLAES